MHAQALAGREALSQAPEQRTEAADPGARWERLPCPPLLIWDLGCGALLTLLVLVCPAQVILT